MSADGLSFELKWLQFSQCQRAPKMSLDIFCMKWAHVQCNWVQHRQSLHFPVFVCPLQQCDVISKLPIPCLNFYWTDLVHMIPFIHSTFNMPHLCSSTRTPPSSTARTALPYHIEPYSIHACIQLYQMSQMMPTT